jgi:hypothetical protein
MIVEWIETTTMAQGCAFCEWSRVVVSVLAVGAFSGLASISLIDGGSVPVWVWIGMFLSVCVSATIAFKVVTARQHRSKG